MLAMFLDQNLFDHYRTSLWQHNNLLKKKSTHCLNFASKSESQHPQKMGVLPIEDQHGSGLLCYIIDYQAQLQYTRNLRHLNPPVVDK